MSGIDDPYKNGSVKVLVPFGEWIISIWHDGDLFFRHCGTNGSSAIKGEANCLECNAVPPKELWDLTRLLGYCWDEEDG